MVVIFKKKLNGHNVPVASFKTWQDASQWCKDELEEWECDDFFYREVRGLRAFYINMILNWNIR